LSQVSREGSKYENIGIGGRGVEESKYENVLRDLYKI
jgi:hypothetical protein